MHKAEWDWRLVAGSALLCTLAFNLIFSIQELFLVIPKALTPGLHPTLFHNNHTWTGDNPLAGLLQGTGAMADLACGFIFAGLFATQSNRSVTTCLFLFWMGFQGFYLALPQFVIGALIPANDVGMAMTYLGLSVVAKRIAALVAIIAMAIVGFWLARRFVRFVAASGETATAPSRLGFVFRGATLPALASVILLIPFREPRNLIEVLLLPLIVMMSGVIWIQFGAWFAPPAQGGERASPSLAFPAAALALVLAIFQIVLRPGVRFY